MFEPESKYEEFFNLGPRKFHSLKLRDFFGLDFYLFFLFWALAEKCAK